MKKQRLIPLLALMLIFALFLGCASVAPTAPTAPTETAAPETPAPTPAATPTPTATPEPIAVPEPTATPGPTAAPQPSDAPAYPGGLPDDLAGSCWWLYSYTAGDSFANPWEDGMDNWLEFYADAPLVNYFERVWDGEWTQLRAADVTRNGEGLLCFSGEVNGIAVRFTVTALGEGELELNCSWENPDGTAGESVRWFNRAWEDMDGRNMGSRELDALLAELEPTDWGFFHDTYACPQEINWEQVAAGGLGIAVTPTGSRLTDWREYSGDQSSRPVGIPAQELESLVREKTGTDYGEAKYPILWWYRDADSDLWISAYSPVYAQAPQIQAGYRKGDECRLYFRLFTDPESDAPGLAEQVYKITMVLAPAGWQFRSCSAAGTVEPVVLATLRYFDTGAEAKADGGVSTFISTEHLDSDEPNWVWAVVEAQTDGVKYCLRRASLSGEYAEAMEALAGAVVPDIVLSSGELNKGDKVALEVNLAWYPHLRLDLQRDCHWADYWFDEDLWNPAMERSATRYLVGHDLDGEYRGCNPYTEGELLNVLTDGAWYITDSTGREVQGCLFFYPDGELDVVLPEDWCELRFTPMRQDPDSWEAPDMLRLTRITDYWSDHPGETIPMGDYRLELTQLQGEQVLALYAADEINGLAGTIPAWVEGATSFYLRRYQGTVPGEAVG